jgi:uncharacterized protein YeaO (DUF488 family)
MGMRSLNVLLRFRTVQIGSPRKPGEGLRIGTVRFLPRGISKADYGDRDLFDLWLPILAPSRRLLMAFRDGTTRFFQRYRSEMAETDPRQVIQLLAALAQQTLLSVACYRLRGSDLFCRTRLHCLSG